MQIRYSRSNNMSSFPRFHSLYYKDCDNELTAWTGPAITNLA